ncbi:DUF3885 domain-containing protein [Paenibacillus tarimensis]|uniref:DUF3885 domain-containing protein n=1 Tax=Paenibacillus tarimensis TaxID=416012 RepID=UPI001F46C616|nr:DUF3885 domain-containing protein [Paenibacillus tarimensis]MCF2942810.1 DUF3885 domain-containing protein [Paenibacillus tarimensis]
MNIVKEMTSHGPYIRYELGLENLVGEAYRCESLRRARSIYRSIIEPEDNVVFIHRTSYDRSDRQVGKVRLKRFFRSRLPQVRSRILPYEFDESDEDLWTKEWSVEVKAKEILMPYLLEAIENTDFIRKPDSGGRIYLYNQTKDILFHMYDDRGCDVFSSDKSSLLPFYHLHRKWILDYNRYEIDGIFGEGLAGIIETDEEQKNRRAYNNKKVTDSGINLRRANICHVTHDFKIPSIHADKFEEEISLTSFTIQRILSTNDQVTYTASKAQALALIDYQTLLMCMYGKKYGSYDGWSFEKLDSKSCTGG